MTMMFSSFIMLLWIGTFTVNVSGGGHFPGAGEPVSYPKIPSDANWTDFQCFSDEEIAAFREDYGFTEDKIEIWSLFQYQMDDWSLDSLALAILQREILGIQIELFQFYDGAASLIGDEANAALFHSGIFKKHNGFALGIESKTAATHSQTRWRIRGDVQSEIESELGSDSTNNLYLDHWKLYTHPAVIQAMNSSNEVTVTPDDDGHFACTHQHGCYFGDSTWYPPQCNFTTNAHLNCMVLIQFLPEHDDEMNRNLIETMNIPMVIKYIGSERTIIGQENFHRLYSERLRVIFQLRSVETQSLDAMGWTSIALPNEDKIISSEAIVRLRPSWLLKRALALYILHEFSSLSAAQSQQIQFAIFAANQPETADLRIQGVCEWLKHPMSQQYGWNFWFLPLKTPQLSMYECHKLTDKESEYISKWSDEEIIAAAGDSDFWDGLRGMDSYKAIWAKRYCISDFEEEKDSVLYTCGFVLWGVAAFILVSAIIGTIRWRKEKIIRASAVNMMALIYVGAAFALIYIWILEPDILSHCYLRKYVLQIGVVTMFGALEEKSRRLATIQKNIKLLKSVKISDLSLMLRVAAMLFFVICYLSVLVAVFPMEVKTKIVDRQRRTECQWDDGAQTAYTALIVAEILALSLIARLSWRLRTTNEVYNETKWIGFILFSSVLLFSGYLLAGLLETASKRLIVESYFVSAAVLIVISALILPKFHPIVMGTIYNPDSLEHDSISFSSTLTQEDLRRMRKYLRRFGYRVYKKGDGQFEGMEVESRTGIFDPHNQDRHHPRSANGSVRFRKVLTTMREMTHSVFSRMDSIPFISRTNSESSPNGSGLKAKDVSITISDTA